MIINIFGSTGVIGRKTLTLISHYFPFLKVNLLCANKNYKLLIKQTIIYKPKYIYLGDESKHSLLRTKLGSKIKILNFEELKDYLIRSKSDFSILAISGYKSLNFLEQIIKNTNNLGLVNKEAIVSAGHLFNKKKYFNQTNIFPIDSEHYSIFEFFKNKNKNPINEVNKITLTASGGPFYNKKYSDLKHIKFNEAIKHPKWKMGYKNSIDSATLVNKCLEVIEAHYLFNIPYNKIDVIIHPEAIVHSIVENKNFVSNMNLFKNDMSIPIFNFLNSSKFNSSKLPQNLSYNSYKKFNFINIKNQIFPIYRYFNKLDKIEPSNLIKFNVGNEYAVNLFKNNLIKYTDIYKIIKRVGRLNLYSSLKNIKDIVDYHAELEKHIYKIFKNQF